VLAAIRPLPRGSPPTPRYGRFFRHRGPRRRGRRHASRPGPSGPRADAPRCRYGTLPARL